MDIMQVCRQSVVASFIAKNLHPQQLSLTPTIGLAKGELMATMYDCTSDVLLMLFPPLQWILPVQSIYEPAGLVILWAIDYL